jgi:alpha-tubulin suppressor-like RCC1 family protein
MKSKRLLGMLFSVFVAATFIFTPVAQAIVLSGTPQGWGANGAGQLGDGTTTQRNIPVQVSGITGVIAIAAGCCHTLALKDDGTVWAWGNNWAGQLGDGTTTWRYTPVQVSGITGVIAIAAGYDHSIALKNDGTVWAWGSNSHGQLGTLLPGLQQSSPVQVSGLTSIIAITGGGWHSIALKNDGTVWAWGTGADGQLGNGTNTNKQYTPVQVSGLTGVVAVAGGWYHSIALKNDGTVWAWGNNWAGQLGDGTTTQRNIPAQVSGLTGMAAIAGGGYHTIALKNNGTAWGWGYNYDGEVGDGTGYNNKYTPVQVSGLTGVAAIEGGERHTIAIKNDGTVWAWGYNAYGQVGDGTTNTAYAPVQVSGLTGVVAITGGGWHSIAIKFQYQCP